MVRVKEELVATSPETLFDQATITFVDVRLGAVAVLGLGGLTSDEGVNPERVLVKVNRGPVVEAEVLTPENV